MRNENENEHESLATEVLHVLKEQVRRYHILLILTIVLLLISNCVWAYCYALHKEAVNQQHSLNGHDNSKVVQNVQGEVNISDGEIK